MQVRARAYVFLHYVCMHACANMLACVHMRGHTGFHQRTGENTSPCLSPSAIPGRLSGSPSPRGRTRAGYHAHQQRARLHVCIHAKMHVDMSLSVCMHTEECERAHAQVRWSAHECAHVCMCEGVRVSDKYRSAHSPSAHRSGSLCVACVACVACVMRVHACLLHVGVLVVCVGVRARSRACPLTMIFLPAHRLTNHHRELQTRILGCWSCALVDLCCACK